MSTSKIYVREIFYPGHLLMTQGEVGVCAYVIERGKVEVFTNTVEAGKTVLAELGAGDIVGEMAIITQEPRSASAVVLEESVLVRVTADDFADGLKTADGNFQALVRVLIERLRHANSFAKTAAVLTAAQMGNASIDSLEHDIKNTVKLVENKIAVDKRQAFRAEVFPIVKTLLNVLRKYS